MVLNRRIIYGSVILLMAIPYLFPIVLPLKVSDPTLDSYNTMEDIDDGAVVLLTVETDASRLAEMESGITAMARYVASRNFKLVIVSSVTDQGPLVTQEYIEPVLEEYGLEYGVDYVHLGFVPGKGVAYAAMAEDIRSVVQKDFRGTELDSIPMMENINRAEDIDLLITIDSSSGMMYSVSYFGTPYDTPIVGCAVASCFILRYAEYKAGMIQGIIGGLTGFAEFEKLINRPGIGTAGLSSLTVGHLIVIGLIILGNVEYLRDRSKGDA